MAEPYNVTFTLAVMAEDAKDAARKGKNAMQYCTQFSVSKAGKFCGVIDVDGGFDEYRTSDGRVQVD